MKCRASVTFEYETRAPQTHQIAELEANHPHTVAMRVLHISKNAVRPVAWTSLVVVLERLK